MFLEGILLKVVKHMDCVVKAELVTTHSRLLTTLTKEAVENIVGKGENAGNQHFLLFPNVFYTSQNKV